MSSVGVTRLALTCEQCGLPFALSLTGIVGARDLRRLPDPFEVRCPMCKHLATYPKSAIQALTVTQATPRQ
jgi:hypothetical protein